MPKVYAVYKGDTFIDVGTIKELAKRLMKKETSLLFMSTPAYKRRHKENSNAIELIKLEYEETEER